MASSILLINTNTEQTSIKNYLKKPKTIRTTKDTKNPFTPFPPMTDAPEEHKQPQQTSGASAQNPTEETVSKKLAAKQVIAADSRTIYLGIGSIIAVFIAAALPPTSKITLGIVFLSTIAAIAVTYFAKKEKDYLTKKYLP